MGGCTITSQIITGVIIGVSAGLILSAVLDIRQRVIRWIERRDQIKYIRQIAENFQEQILSAEHVVSAPNAPPSLTPDAVHQIRWAYLESAHSQVVSTLDGRASTLSFDEKMQVRNAFYEYEQFRALGISVLLPNQCHMIFDKLEAIEWLKVKIVDRTAIGLKPQ